MSRLRAYNTYQPVQYDYVTELPEGWQLLPNLAIFQERIERGHEDEQLLSVTISRGVIKQSELDKKDSSTLDKSKYLLVYPGDLVYSMRFRQGASGYSIHKGIVSPACTVLRPKKGTKTNPRYYYYMFRTGFYKNYVERLAYGIADGQIPLRYVDFKRMYSIVPPLETQNAIVAYLDRKTQQIKSFIQKKERLIELLEEEKQSKIDACISNGFNKKGSLINERKDIPPYPSHWHLTRLKYLFKILNGYAFSTSSFISEGIQVLKISSLYQNRLSLERQPTFVSPSYLKKLPQFIVSKNDILMSLTGTLGKEDYGFAVLLNGDDVYLLNQRVAKLIPNKKLNTKYALYLLRSRVFLDQLYLQPSGTKQANLSNDHILPLYIAIPEVYEQEKNIERLERELSKLENGILNAKSEIKKATEYKESLITQVITGQLKVPTLTLEKVMN